jgi:hypothetical protein
MPPGKYAVPFAVAVCLFGFCPRAYALATEHFGNDPIDASEYKFGGDVLAVANLQSRFYWYEVNGDPHFYYRGNTAALNEALRKFAALAGNSREVILLPGPAEQSTLGDTRRFAFDWVVHTPAGPGRGGPPTMTVYLQPPPSPKPPDAAAVARWIADLDNDAFETRERASRELEKILDPAVPALRKARDAGPPAETRRRIDQLLERVPGMDLRLVEMPAGVTVLELKNLLDRYHKGMKNADPQARGKAVTSLGRLADCTDVVPDLIAVITGDKHEYVRRCAASALYRMGKRGAPALPALKAGLNDPDVNVRNLFDVTVKQIEGADDKPARDPVKLRAALEGISAFCQTLPAAARK